MKETIGRRVPITIENYRWYDIEIVLNGNETKLYLDGELIHDVRDESSFSNPFRVVPVVHNIEPVTGGLSYQFAKTSVTVIRLQGAELVGD